MGMEVAMRLIILNFPYGEPMDGGGRWCTLDNRTCTEHDGCNGCQLALDYTGRLVGEKEEKP